MNKCVLLMAIVGTFYNVDAIFKTKGKYGLWPEKDASGAKQKWEYHNDNLESCGKLDIAPADMQKLKQEKMLQVDQLPWVVYLVEKRGKNYYYPVCMATLLPDVDEDSTSILLTNSDCGDSKHELTDYYIYTGKELPVPKDANVIPLESAVVDKTTLSPTSDNAMVITIDGLITLGAEHNVVCLPEPDAAPKPGSPCMMMAVRAGPKGTLPTLYTTRYEEGRECRSKTHLANYIHSQQQFCGWDERHGTMMAKGGPMVCLEGDRWVQYGIAGYSQHTMESYKEDGVENARSGTERPSGMVNVGRFRKLLSDSKNLQQFGRINLMRHR